ncbi:MAG: V-type ATP synthase subunit B, partial [Gammaproteobacteria bacterium]
MLADLYTHGTLRKIEGPLLFLRRNLDVGLNDAVEVIGKDGRGRLGRVASLDEETIVIEVLESTTGLSLEGPRVRFFGEPLRFAVGPGLLGRVFDGVGRILDGGPPLPGTQRWRIDGMPLNPTARAKPADFIETGISTIDLMNSLVRGQKLPIFSGGGLPHDRMAVQIAQHARLPDDEGGRFATALAGIGIPSDTPGN